MKNNFYNEFDYARLKESQRGNEYRTHFQIDRDRIIHSSEFRRLQGKTQVFLPGEYDFYRTRLTHSIEVAQIGRSICNFIFMKNKDLFSDDYFIDPDLVESVCLTHDLGNPPFGHAGERKLNLLMQGYGGYEGNAQTLRSITETFYRDENKRRGMNPTRAFLDGILKYKRLYNSFDAPFNHFLYDEQNEYLKFVFENDDIKEKLNIDEINTFRSIECQIMDWADDTAYAINDLVDSISGGFLTIEKLAGWQKANSALLNSAQQNLINDMIEWMKIGKFKAKFGMQIGDFIQAVKIEEKKNFLSGKTNRYKYGVIIDSEIFEKAQLYKKISVELVFQSAQLHQIEFKGNMMIEKLFSLFEENYIKTNSKIKLLPDFDDKYIRDEKDPNKKARLICDYMSGMTDSYAMRTYRRLFDSGYGSMVEVL
ncbi:MAG: deoxyguanosinetriphosphate triphosphohydrolase [Flavobacterium sp.]|nr:deoxyguanosinetriphosphate triphosphohydrolase [Flavobacterium sp.]